MKLSASNLIKKYKQRSVVNDVSIEVSQGEIVGLLGPNGAGKTTLLRSILGLVPVHSGTVTINGNSRRKERG